MFRHKGKRRTHIHNLRLASILSFIAGMVNITGVLSVKTLTTNVTGHFAFFAEELVKGNYFISFVFLIFILSFLLGSFVSNLLIETTLRIKPAISHAPPMVIEILALMFVGLSGNISINFGSNVMAGVLLFAMGIQNSLVTKVSDSVVRTTHLTGLFTDLGIELSQLFFYRKTDESMKLRKSIHLRLIIISFFFLGCIIGGYVYRNYELKTLLIASGCLTIALLYDNILYGFYRLRRKFQF